MSYEPYSQHIIFNITYKWAQHARVLHCDRPERLFGDKHSSFWGPFVSYEENEALQVRSQETYSQLIIFNVTYKWAQELWYCTMISQKGLSWINTQALGGPFVSYRENEALQIRSQETYSQLNIFNVTYKWAQHARVLHCDRPERLGRYKQSSFWGPFVSYGENEALQVRSLAP